MKMTPDILVEQIVAVLAPNGGLVWATDIDTYCDNHGIERQSPRGKHNNIFWNAELHEAGEEHRLLKFKTAPTQNAPNLFALRREYPVAPAPVGGHPGRQHARDMGYVECVWLGTKWDWRNAKVPPL
jgi:hypothetical protein